jgi:endonuclease/exonuclease/phosphatase family metal-dependent hydrolase
VETVRVATLNIWNRSGPWQHRLALIRKQFEDLGPDILGLQEVLRLTDVGASPDTVWRAPEAIAADSASDQASAIAAGSGYYIAYGTAADLGGGLFFGNAVLSRHPIVEHRVIALPGHESGEHRSMCYALVEHPRGLLPVFVTHLNWKLHHGSVRLRQVAAIASHVKSMAPIDDARLPPVVMGDFNAEPESDEIRFMRGLATVDGKTVYFGDAWTYGGDGTPGYTYDRRNRFAALAHEPPRRIDYIFVRGPDRTFRGEPVRTALAFCQAEHTQEGDVWPSDHFGLVTDLVVSARSA